MYEQQRADASELSVENRMLLEKTEQLVVDGERAQKKLALLEAQAVDRAHRIGQTRRVFAYRLIARDTVEEKILALQDRKRELAESIVQADESLITSLTAEDVELLLS